MKRSTIKGATILAGIGLLGVAGWSWATGWAPPAERYAFQGIDLGADAGALDWGSVRAAGADFTYLAATAGTAVRVGSFEENWAGVAEAGLRRGAVHLFSLCRPGTDQADVFNTVVPRDAGALPATVALAFDSDCPARPERAVLIGEVARFVARVEAHTGKPMLLRVDRAFEAEYRVTAAMPRPIWAVGNLFAPGYAARPWRLWRASDFRRIEGVDGPVNWNVVAP